MSGKSRTRKLNCWEYMGCGKGVSGSETDGISVCPAAVDKGLDMTHGGKHAGRACWVVPDTLCNGTGGGAFSSKFKHCRRCTFYIKVRMEEGVNFRLPMALMNIRDGGHVERADSLAEE